MREMHAQKKTFWRRCSQTKREAGDGIEPVWNRRGSASSAVKMKSPKFFACPKEERGTMKPFNIA
jgi:hypothetical protein